MLLHSIKHHKNDVIGILLGSKKGNGVEVVDAIPLFHTRVFSSSLEIAFEMVEAYLNVEQPNLKIVGIYEGRLSGNLEATMSPLAQAVAENIKS